MNSRERYLCLDLEVPWLAPCMHASDFFATSVVTRSMVRFTCTASSENSNDGKDSSRGGPRFPQVVVLVGATGDLARRKLLPGLFHLASAGFIPGCSIIGVSLDEIDADGFRAVTRSALDEFSTRKATALDWDVFAKNLDYVPLASGARRTGGGRRAGGAEVSRRKSPSPLPQRAAQCGVVRRAGARRSETRRAFAGSSWRSLSVPILRVRCR